MKKAYKQLAVSPGQLRYMVVAVYDPTTNQWRFAVSWALPFGLSGAVLHFNRVPALITAFCRRWLAIPVQHFFDDFRIVEPQFADESGYKWFARAADFFRWRFDPSKDVSPRDVLPMLGCLEDWSRAHTDFFAVHADLERIIALQTITDGVRSARHCPKGVAASLRGKVLHLAGTKPGKTGRGNYLSLSALADGHGPSWSDELD